MQRQTGGAERCRGRQVELRDAESGGAERCSSYFGWLPIPFSDLSVWPFVFCILLCERDRVFLDYSISEAARKTFFLI